jgi:hypothetical protein
VEIYDASSSSYIYGFCALSSPDSLTTLWFAVPEGQSPPNAVYVLLTDRRDDKQSRSNDLALPIVTPTETQTETPTVIPPVTQTETPTVSPTETPTVSPTPDLTVVITGARETCSGKPLVCDITVDFTVTNAGAGDVTGDFSVLIQADPELSKSNMITVSGLPAGASADLSQTLSSPFSCHDPDCTVQVMVDPDNLILESNENNNIAAQTSPG